MRWLGKICFLVLASGLAFAQNVQNAAPSGAKSAADEIQALREAVAQQQQLINQQQQQIDALKKALEPDAATPHVENAALHTGAPLNANNAVQGGEEKPKASPLSFRIGGTEFTPGGFVDFENVFRSTNTGNVAATNFWAIPFSNTVNGHLTEYRSTGQYSRFNLKITGKYGANDVTGYVEADFNGNDPANVFVSSNSHTDRLRVYWLDLKRGKWEFLGGQTWGLQTPNRVGISPNPADLMLTYGEDAQVHVGVNYTRAAEFRAAYHFNDQFVWAVAIQNPQQFVGQGAEVAFPAAFNAQLGGGNVPQFDNASNPGTPNVAPDLLTKLAADGNPGGRHMHFEAGGVMTTAKATIIPVGGTTFQSTSTVGGGVFGGVLLSMTKDFRFVADGMWGTGVGRYLIGTAPQVVVVPVQTGLATFTAHTSPVHSGDAIFGLELQANPKTLFGAYYGVMYAQRNAFPDPTSTTVLTIPINCSSGNPLQTKPCIGFGGTNQVNATSQNRAIQEGTFDWTQTFWRNPQYGAVLLVTQYSYVTRATWFVANGAPKNAHLSMGYLSLRYVLP